MTDVALLIADMVRAGVDPDLIGRTAAALAEREPATIVEAPAMTPRQARNRRYYEGRRLKASESVLIQTDQDAAKKVPPDTPFEETNLTPPKEPLKGFQKVPAPSSKKGTRLPENFEPSEVDALEIGLNRSAISEEREKFRDYWRAQPGQRGVKVDWPATWRNWCRKAAADRGLKPRPKASGPPKNDALWLQRAWDYANDGWYRDWGSPKDIPPEHRHRFPNLEKWKSEFPDVDQTQGTA